MRTLSSGHIVHRRQPFLLPPTLKHSHSAEQASGRGSAHTDVAQAAVWMKSSVWFVFAKKCTHLRLRRISDATQSLLLVESVPRSDRGLAHY